MSKQQPSYWTPIELLERFSAYHEAVGRLIKSADGLVGNKDTVSVMAHGFAIAKAVEDLGGIYDEVEGDNEPQQLRQ
jgi:hypothetical protein